MLLFSVMVAEGEELFIRFTVCASFPFGFEGGMWDLVVFVPGHCLSFCFENLSIFIALPLPSTETDVKFYVFPSGSGNSTDLVTYLFIA
ncbi:MAG: hypothetical protein KUF82_20660 [Candidatus Thiodiazotropha sp. (ex Ctena orbiculata)]|nr:hypothetical protein [Candidatus Thiodiazotropha taylori]